MSDQKLHVDPSRIGLGESGIYIRAVGPEGKWGTFDIVDLDKESLLTWLRSRGGDNPWAEDVVGILLGHGHLHPLPEPPNGD